MSAWKLLILQTLLMISVVVLGKSAEEVSIKIRSKPVCNNNVPEETTVQLHDVCGYTSNCKRANELAECIEITRGDCVCELPGAAEERKGNKSSKKDKSKKKDKKKDGKKSKTKGKKKDKKKDKSKTNKKDNKNDKSKGKEKDKTKGKEKAKTKGKKKDKTKGKEKDKKKDKDKDIKKSKDKKKKKKGNKKKGGKNGTDMMDTPTTEPPELVLDESCPPVIEGQMGTCDQECDSNMDCEGEEVCCSNGCGRQCIQLMSTTTTTTTTPQPTTTPFIQHEYCPKVMRRSMHNCTQQCGPDNDDNCTLDCESDKQDYCTQQCESDKHRNCTQQCEFDKDGNCNLKCDSDKNRNCAQDCESEKIRNCTQQCESDKQRNCTQHCEFDKDGNCTLECESDKNRNCTQECESDKKNNCTQECESDQDCSGDKICCSSYECGLQCTEQVIPTTTLPPGSICAEGWDQYGNLCYLVTPKDGFHELEEYCQKQHEGAHLTSINTDYELYYLIDIYVNVIGDIYIGLNYSVEYGYWEYTDRNSATINKNTKEEDELDSKYCMVVTDTPLNEWRNVYCYEKYLGVCRYLLGSCDEGWKRFSDSCYKRSEEADSRYRSIQQCKNDHPYPEAKLVSIHSYEELDFVNAVHNRSRFGYWVGLSSLRYVWYFLDDTSLLFTHWYRKKAHPSYKRDCIATTWAFEHRWVSYSCSDDFYSVCKYRLSAKREVPSSNTR